MNVADATTLLVSLLQRLDADAGSARPSFGALVSDAERDALRIVVAELKGAPIPPPDVAETLVALDESVLARNLPETEWVLCLDFGTAKSKAFAATQAEEPDCLELPIGQADSDLDDAVYAVSSSVWIEDDGKAFVGSEAVKRGQRYDGTHERRRLDSLKQEISQIHLAGDAEDKVLRQDVNPTTVPLTVEDAVTFFLAYLTDLATTALEDHIGSRYARRRFTLPCWADDQRQWASALIARSLARAQLLADTFHGRWRDGIDVRLLKEAIGLAAEHDETLLSLLDGDETAGLVPRYRGGVLEPLAAASSRVWKDDVASRGVVLVVDIGAGTTDVSLFWSVQNVEGKGHRAFPVKPCAAAIKQAGDSLDSLLVHELLKRANLGADPALRERASRLLYLEGVRTLKETLFETGTITKRLANDETVTMALEEFLATEGVARFVDAIRSTVGQLLSQVRESWAVPVESGVTLVLTGGGSRLPMMRDLARESWTVAGRVVRCRLASELPQIVADEFDTDFQQEYPQLAVALGGSMPMLLDERDALEDWHGGAPPPRGLERFPTRGA